MDQDRLHYDYVSWIAFGRYPENPSVPMPASSNNGKGAVSDLLLLKHKELKIASVTMVQSIAGSVRANHYHKTDWHFMFVLVGEMHYFWRPIGNVEQPQVKIFKPMEMIFTPPRIEHAMYFPVDTVVMTFCQTLRSQDERESDLVRVKLIEVAAEEK